MEFKWISRCYTSISDGLVSSLILFLLASQSDALKVAPHRDFQSSPTQLDPIHPFKSFYNAMEQKLSFQKGLQKKDKDKDKDKDIDKDGDKDKDKYKDKYKYKDKD